MLVLWTPYPVGQKKQTTCWLVVNTWLRHSTTKDILWFPKWELFVRLTRQPFSSKINYPSIRILHAVWKKLQQIKKTSQEEYWNCDDKTFLSSKDFWRFALLVCNKNRGTLNLNRKWNGHDLIFPVLWSFGPCFSSDQWAIDTFTWCYTAPDHMFVNENLTENPFFLRRLNQTYPSLTAKIWLHLNSLKKKRYPGALVDRGTLWHRKICQSQVYIKTENAAD